MTLLPSRWQPIADGIVRVLVVVSIGYLTAHVLWAVFR